jgi:hypothetical protein
MHLVYMDDLGDKESAILSALLVSAAEWRNAFQPRGIPTRVSIGYPTLHGALDVYK